MVRSRSRADSSAMRCMPWRSDTGVGRRRVPVERCGVRQDARGAAGRCTSRCGLARSTRLPCRGDVLDWLIEVDRTVAAWEPNGKGTVDRLHELAGRGFRPQDCELIDDYADDLQRWTLAATEILAPAVRVTLRQPCPSCGAGHAYRDSGGEQVRSRALRVTETGCSAWRAGRRGRRRSSSGWRGCWVVSRCLRWHLEMRG